TRREPRPDSGEQRHLVAEVKEGLAFVVRHRLLRAITACTGTSNLASSAAMVALISLLASPRQLNLSAGTIGLLFTVGSAGGVVGALTASRFARLVGQGQAIWLSGLFWGPTAFVAPFVHRGWSLGLLAAAQFVGAIGIVTYNITQVSFRQ